jgi:AcrR family transcriptional regulator
MGRPPKYPSDRILDAVLDSLRRFPARQLTVAIVADCLGAPSGSIYHRFASRDALLATAWLRSGERFQAELAGFASAADPLDGGLGAVRHTLDWARRRPAEAVFVLLNTRSDFTSGEWPPQLARRATRLGNDITDTVRTFAARIPGISLGRARFALLDVPQAAIRRAHVTGTALDDEAQRMVEETVGSLLAPEGALTRMAS